MSITRPIPGDYVKIIGNNTKWLVLGMDSPDSTRTPVEVALKAENGEVITAYLHNLMPYSSQSSPQDNAIRHNQGKPELSRIPWDAEEEESKVWAYGADKYGDKNWEKLWGDQTVKVCLDSALRHIAKMKKGAQIDEESGCLHAAHIRSNMAMIIRYVRSKG